MKIKLYLIISIFFFYSKPLIAVTWPYAPAAGQPGSTAIASTSTSIQAWATGYQDLIYGTDISATFQTPEKALGPSSLVDPVFDTVSLGNGGQITMTFNGVIYDGTGADFAIFGNAFSDTFLELAFVEVSSDGINYTRFENFSFTFLPVGAFGNVDPINIHGYAGKYRAAFGTPFDLNELAGTPGLDINNIRYVRLIDILGNGTEFDDLSSEFGGPNPIYDPYKTTQSAGFDLEAVGVIHIQESPPTPIPLPIYSQFILFLIITFISKRIYTTNKN